jgi:hypothetical protein
MIAKRKKYCPTRDHRNIPACEPLVRVVTGGTVALMQFANACTGRMK